jgi:hypothetical protein
MRTESFVLIAIAVATTACSDYSLRLQTCNGPCRPQRTLGAGGSIEILIDQGGGLANDAQLVSSNASILTVERDGQPYDWRVIGVAAGSADILLVGNDDRIHERLTIEVGRTRLEIEPMDSGARGPFPDDLYDAAWRIPRAVDFNLALHPRVDTQDSYGTHFFLVTLDGQPHDCFKYACSGPVWYGSIPFEGLAAGDHVLELQATDGGQRFTYRLIVQ